MAFSLMKLIGIDFVVVLIFYSFNNILLVLEFVEYLWGLIGLLSNYHNTINIRNMGQPSPKNTSHTHPVGDRTPRHISRNFQNS